MLNHIDHGFIFAIESQLLDPRLFERHAETQIDFPVRFASQGSVNLRSVTRISSF